MSSYLFLQKLRAAFSCTKTGIDNFSESPLTMNLACYEKNTESLCNLPDVVLRNIFNKVGLRSILTLRKVCRALRNRIDDIKPEAHLFYVSIRVEDCKISFEYHWEINGEKLGRTYKDYVEYSKAVESGKSIVRCKDVEKTIVNSDFLELALRDFLLILTFQRKRIEIFFSNITENSNNFIQFLEILKNFLSFENQLLEVYKFQIHTKDQKSVIPALSLTDPQSIHSIEIFGWNKECQPMEFTEIMEMEHWKIATSFESDYSITGVSIQNFRHFSRISVTFKSISVEKLLEFKKIFQNSTEAHRFKILYTGTFEDREQLLEKMGPAFMFNKGFEWYFRMSTTDDDILLIKLNNPPYLIIFQRVPVDRVPERAVIQN